jgi:putative transposase
MTKSFIDTLIQLILIRLLPKSRLRSAYFLLLKENQILKRKLDALHVERYPIKPSWLKILYLNILERFKGLRTHLFTISPDTVLKLWKKQLKKHWTYPPKGKKRPGRPRITTQIVDLILKLKQLNPLFGVKRISGELGKLELDVSRESIRRVLHNGRKGGHIQPNGSWSKLLKAHWESMYACDFFTVDTMAFKRFYVFFILELETRKIKYFGITQFPTRSFVVNNLKSFMFDREDEETYLIHDNSGELRSIDYSVYGIRDVATVPYSPDMNAYAERFVGSIRRECLDRLFIFTEKHLRNVVKTYVHFYNHFRPHQGIGNRIPAGCPPDQNNSGEIKVRSQLFGLVNELYREAA